MQTIYKYPLDITDEQTVMIPHGSEILSAQIQGAQLCLWALVDSEATVVKHRVRIFGTGNPVTLNDELVNCSWKFVGTVQDRIFVWHVFVEK